MLRRPAVFIHTTDSGHSLPVAPNLLAQRFVAPAPNRIWLADITYIATGDGWLYLAAVLDLATRKIVGWAMRDHMRTELALAALLMATQRQRPVLGLIHHSDRGSQYAARAYASQLAELGAIASMSRRGCCYDNYNRHRIHSAMGYVTPDQAEQMAASTPVRAIGGRSLLTMKEMLVAGPVVALRRVIRDAA